jgi:Skp family chaperone for outer membrane proteins
MLPKRAGLVPLASLVVLLGLAIPAAAQQQPKAPTPPPAIPAPPQLNVLVVDVQSLLQNAKSAKMVRAQIEAKRAEYAKEISHQEEALRRERDTLQRQQASLSPKELNQKGREFQQKVNELDHSVQAKRQVLEYSNEEALKKIQQVMLRIITDIAKTRKANLVLQRSELVLFDQSFDVTDAVLQRLDEELPTLTVSFAAPPVSPASSTPAPARAAAKKKR